MRTQLTFKSNFQPPSLCLRIIVLILLYFNSGVLASWDDWWAYDGISGPAFWGLLNPQWNLCNKGRRQSPINIEPSRLLYDPQLRPIVIDNPAISGVLRNTGQTVVFTVERGARVNISGGPLSYKYQFEELYMHYGSEDMYGSEHLVDAIPFPAELQLYGFNVDLYTNLSDAQQKPNGVVALSIMIRVSPDDEMPNHFNNQLRVLTSVLNQITYRNQSAIVQAMSLHGLLPETEYYMTYEGSTTHPGCWETVTWVIFNKPIYISKRTMYYMRQLKQGTDQLNPKSSLSNIRPIQKLHHRTVRTNINFPQAQAKKCLTMHKSYYTANLWRPRIM